MSNESNNKPVIDFLFSMPSSVKFLFLGAFFYQLGFLVQAYLIVFMIFNGFSTLDAGWALGVLSGAAVLGTIASSNLSNWIGNKYAIVLGTIAMAVSVSIIPLCLREDNPVWLWSTAVFTCGFFTQMYRAPTAALLSNKMAEKDHVMAFSTYRIALNVGGAIGPIIATILAASDWSYVFWLNGLCSLSFGLITLLLVADDRSIEKSETKIINTSKNKWKTVLTDIKFVWFMLAMFLSSIVFIQFTSTLPLAIEKQGLSLSYYSALLSIYGVVLILFELKISSITRQYDSWLPSTVGTVILCLGVASFGLTIESNWSLVLSVMLMVFGLMISGPTMFAYPAKFPNDVRTTYISATQVSFSLGNALGPIIGLFVFKNYNDALWIGCLILAILCGVLLILGMKNVRPSSNCISENLSTNT